MNQMALFGDSQPAAQPRESADPLQEFFDYCSASDRIIKPPSRDDLEASSLLYAGFKKHMANNFGKWRGGKKQYFEFEFDAVELLDKFQNGQRPNFRKETDFFPTPESVIDQMCQTVIPWGDMKILEPSAGRLDIVKYVNNFSQGLDHDWHLIELNPINRQNIIDAGMTESLIGHDFDEYEPPVNADDLFDAVYANPPFSRIAEHVEKISICLKPYGDAVIVVPANFKNKHAALVQRIEPRFEYVGFYEIPEGSFKQSGTGVSTNIMHLSSRGEF